MAENRRKKMKVDYKKIPETELQKMLEAGLQVIDCHRVLAKTKDSVVGELIGEEQKIYQWTHYPKGDIYDSESHCQCFYHSHDPDSREGEHGHFHLFFDKEARTAGIKPVAVPIPGKHKGKETLSHLIAISMDQRSLPVGLFTVNRWVTNETMLEANDLIKMIDQFELDLAKPSWPVNVWVTSMVRLYKFQIIELILERDATLAKWKEDHPGKDTYMDHDLEITSRVDISVDQHMQELQLLLVER